MLCSYQEPLNPSDFFNSAGDETPRASRSRQSSISSVASDSPFMTPLSFPQQQQYVLPSDIESEMDEPMSSLDAFSKDDLYTYVKKYERKATRYKTKFTEVSCREKRGTIVFDY